MKMPLAARYLDFDPKRDKLNKGRFGQPWFDVLASIYERRPGEIEQRDRRREARTRKIRFATVAGVFAILSLMLLYALEERSEAQKRRDEAIEARNGEAVQRKNAEDSAAEANRRRDESNKERDIAQKKTVIAQQQTLVANKATAEARQQKEFAESNTYVANMALARSEYETGN
jgi:DNA-binding helix-hairpin-helix protein with protein kinase domain